MTYLWFITIHLFFLHLLFLAMCCTPNNAQMFSDSCTGESDSCTGEVKGPLFLSIFTL